MEQLFEPFKKKFYGKYQVDLSNKFNEFEEVAGYVDSQFSKKDPTPSYNDFQREVLKQGWQHFEEQVIKKVDNLKALDFVNSYDDYRHQQTNALKGLYQNTGYGRERQDTKSLTFRIRGVTNPVTADNLSSTGTFSLKLIDTFTIDKLYNVYIDNISIFGGPDRATGANSKGHYLVLKINEINIQSASTISEANSGIVIPIDADTNGIASILKSKKFNYIGTINPGKLTSISGSLIGYKANGTIIGTLPTGTLANDGATIIELLFVAAEKMSWK